MHSSTRATMTSVDTLAGTVKLTMEPLSKKVCDCAASVSHTVIVIIAAGWIRGVNRTHHNNLINQMTISIQYNRLIKRFLHKPMSMLTTTEPRTVPHKISLRCTLVYQVQRWMGCSRWSQAQCGRDADTPHSAKSQPHRCSEGRRCNLWH